MQPFKHEPVFLWSVLSSSLLKESFIESWVEWLDSSLLKAKAFNTLLFPVNNNNIGIFLVCCICCHGTIHPATRLPAGSGCGCHGSSVAWVAVLTLPGLLSVAVAPVGVGDGRRPGAASWRSSARCTWSFYTCLNSLETPHIQRRCEILSDGVEFSRIQVLNDFLLMYFFVRWWTFESC